MGGQEDVCGQGVRGFASAELSSTLPAITAISARHMTNSHERLPMCGAPFMYLT